MLLKKNKKILIYISLLMLITTINNKNIKYINLTKINKINVTGLEEVNNLKLKKKLNFLKISNLFFLDEVKVVEALNSNNLIEKYSIFKKYPSTLNIKIKKTNFLAQIIDKGDNFFLGSNGKLIKTTHIRNDIPFIFGNFDNDSFFDLKTVIDDSNLSYHEIKSFFFFKSGRWDIELNSGLLIKLPKSDLKKTIKFLNNFLESKYNVKIDKIDLRQKNQMIINGK